MCDSLRLTGRSNHSLQEQEPQNDTWHKVVVVNTHLRPIPWPSSPTPSMSTPSASPTMNLHYQLAVCFTHGWLVLRLLCVLHICWSVHESGNSRSKQLIVMPTELLTEREWLPGALEWIEILDLFYQHARLQLWLYSTNDLPYPTELEGVFNL